MGLINWIFDIYQHTKIDEVRKEAMEARLEAARVNRGGTVDGGRLERALQRVDAEDGRADGQAPIG